MESAKVNNLYTPELNLSTLFLRSRGNTPLLRIDSERSPDVHIDHKTSPRCSRPTKDSASSRRHNVHSQPTQFPINLATLANGSDLATRRLYYPVVVHFCMFAASQHVCFPPKASRTALRGYANGTANPANGLGMLVQTILIIGKSSLESIHRVGKRDTLSRWPFAAICDCGDVWVSASAKISRHSSRESMSSRPFEEGEGGLTRFMMDQVSSKRFS